MVGAGRVTKNFHRGLGGIKKENFAYCRMHFVDFANCIISSYIWHFADYNLQIACYRLHFAYCILHLVSCRLLFSCAATQYVLLCVCLSACVSVLGLLYETSLYLEYSRIFKERERDFI